MLDGVRWLVCARCNVPVSKIPDRQTGERECVESLYRNHSETCPCRWPEDTETTMRRVMDK